MRRNVKMLKIFSIYGELNTDGVGVIATIDDLNYNVCCGLPQFEGLIELEDGIYLWRDRNDIKEIFEKDSEIEKWEFEELENLEGEYVKVMDSVKPTLYDELLNDIDELQEEIVSYKESEDNERLDAVSRSTLNNTIYIYNYFKNEDGILIKNETMINKSMLLGIF